jgi:two-component system sensor histidine kinase HydH
MLYQAFLNILINAMQAMPQGGKISIQICSSGNSVEIFFEDQGEGIAEDILEKIWDPFFTTKSKGTGLGLGIVKNIIESHGGTVQIANGSQSGARVTVKIPIEQGV